MLEISNYGKFEVAGPGAAEWLSHVMANRVPSVGRISLTPMLNERGKLIGDFTMCRPSEHRFLSHRHSLAAEIYYSGGLSVMRRRRRVAALVRDGVRRSVGRRSQLARLVAEPRAG